MFKLWGLKQHIVIIPIILGILFFVNVNCLAQDAKITQQEQDNKKVKIDTIRKHIETIESQRKKIAILLVDTANIGKTMSDLQEEKLLYFLLARNEEALVAVDNLYSTMFLYVVMTSQCEPNKDADYIMKNLFSKQKRTYETVLDYVNAILGATKNPAIALQCDKLKTEIRICIDTTDKASELLQ